MGKASRFHHRRERSTVDSAIGLASAPLGRSVTFEEMDRATKLVASADGALRLVCSLCGNLTVARWEARAVSEAPTVVEVLAATGKHSREHIKPETAGAQAAASNPHRVDL